MKKLCVVCGKNEAMVPDRNRPGRPIKRVCRQCHGARLADDLRRWRQRWRNDLPDSPENDP